jgi:4-amino-4-deoxy-L-arabinose transferase-like glycosyltransferase
VPRAGWWGGLILALDPGSVLNSNLVITETLYTWLIAASLLLLVSYWRHARLGYLFAAGLLLGLSILSRPAGTYLPVLAAIWVFLFAARTWRSSTAALCPLLIGLAIPLVPWAARNHSTFGAWQLSSIQGLNLFFCKAADLESNSLGDQERSNAALKMMEEEIRPAIEETPRNQLEMAQLYQTFAVRRLLRQPVPYARLHVLGTVKLLLSHHAHDFYLLNGWKYQETGLLAMLLGGGEDSARQSGPRDWFAISFALGETCWLLALYILAVLALWRGWRVETRALLVLLVLMALYSVALPGPEGIARFRVPAMPAIALLAGLGVGRLRMLSFKRSSAVGVA